MIGEIIRTDTIYEFLLGEQKLTYINYPIIAHIQFDNSRVWESIGNIATLTQKSDQLIGKIKDLAYAFKYIDAQKTFHREHYIFAFIEDYQTKTVYYDDDFIIEEMLKTYPIKHDFFETKIKVDAWNKVPTQ